jgi:hypothetical protein
MVVTIIIINNSATAAVAARFPVFGFPTIIAAKTLRRSARVFYIASYASMSMVDAGSRAIGPSL